MTAVTWAGVIYGYVSKHNVIICTSYCSLLLVNLQKYHICRPSLYYFEIWLKRQLRGPTLKLSSEQDCFIHPLVPQNGGSGSVSLITEHGCNFHVLPPGVKTFPGETGDHHAVTSDEECFPTHGGKKNFSRKVTLIIRFKSNDCFICSNS